MSLKSQRNEVLFQRYIDTLKLYGKDAVGMKKGFIYEQVAEPLFVDPKYVGRLVCHMLKDKNRRKVFEEDDDLRYVLEELDKIAKKRR